jgi:hypothetical protein
MRRGLIPNHHLLQVEAELASSGEVMHHRGVPTPTLELAVEDWGGETGEEAKRSASNAERDEVEDVRMDLGPAIVELVNEALRGREFGTARFLQQRREEGEESEFEPRERCRAKRTLSNAATAARLVVGDSES